MLSKLLARRLEAHLPAAIKPDQINFDKYEALPLGDFGDRGVNAQFSL